jgi:hypothetical protein
MERHLSKCAHLAPDGTLFARLGVKNIISLNPVLLFEAKQRGANIVFK